MNSFEFYSPTKIYFGNGAENRTGAILRDFGATSVLLVYGGNSARKSGLLDLIRYSLKEQNLSVTELGGVVPNPRVNKVYEGISAGLRTHVDFVLAIGGGSCIDTAKAIAYGIAEADRDVWELFAHKRKATACLPVESVLTIAAAGSESSNGCVITNEATGEKRAYDDDLARPKFAVMNPAYTMSLPDFQTESGCVDIMMHTMERYFTNSGNMEITDAIAEGLLRTVMKNAVILHQNPVNYDARAEVMWAGSLAHNDLTGCGNGGGDFMSHQLEHELGGMFDVTHGAGLAAIWPSWARYVYRDCMTRFVKFARNVMDITIEGSDEEIAEAGICAMENFYHSIGMPVNIRELGIAPTEGQIEEMADRCRTACGEHRGSARRLSVEDMIQIYKNAR
ncbi:MAG: iron-containing alcohol dehydrogenase [Lachnospiraceae bacterium]|nr:iron-containing alcohol dehydrogenase [Lachnospiraceae bacterium]